MAVDARQAAIDAEADRLLGIYVQVKVLGQKRQMEFEQAGRAAVTEGLVSAAAWVLVWGAVGV